MNKTFMSSQITKLSKILYNKYHTISYDYIKIHFKIKKLNLINGPILEKAKFRIMWIN